MTDDERLQRCVAGARDWSAAQSERRRATSRRGGGAPCGSNNYGQEPPGGGSYQVYADCDGRGSQAGRGSGRNLSAATAANGAAATVARGSSSKSIAERLNGQSLHVEKMGVELRMDSTTAVRKCYARERRKL